LLPPVPDIVNLHVEQPAAFVSEEQKSSQFDKFDEEKLLTEIPKKFQKNALELLEKIREDPLSIDFNSKGELFIDSVSIPNANIFHIFPELFVRKRKTIVPGLSDLATKIAYLNYGSLINKGIGKGLKRPKSYEFHEETVPTLKEFKNWWYMSM